MSHLPRLLLLALVAAAAFVLPGSGIAEVPVLNGVVGSPTSPNARTISLTDASGNRVVHIDPGTYTIVVRDYANEHDFHLFGPGVDQSTDVEGTGTTTWTVTFRNGIYRYQCDPHASTMRGSFTVGVVPKVPKLKGTVGPGRTISLKTASGSRVKKLVAGTYKITVRDATRVDNFHLFGAGVNKKTAVRARGSVTWTVKFRAGTYRYRSDAHRRLAGKFAVTPATT